jgi:hypothetical protein
MSESTVTPTNHRRTGVALAAAVAVLLVCLAWLPTSARAGEQEPTRADAAQVPGPPSGGLESQLDVLRESQRTLEREGVEAPDGGSADGARAAPGAGAWFIQGVLRGVGHAGTVGGFEAIMTALGADRTEAMLAEMSSTLNELIGQVEAIATRMEQLFADSQFKNTHRDARMAYDVVDGWARVIEGFERSGNEPSAMQLNNVAQGSYAAVASLRGLLTDAETGAIPLILNAYGQKSPVSTGAQQWEEVEAYRDHFLAVQALALTNLAWVAGHDDSYGPTYLEPAVEIARETQRRTHEITGAPHPQDPGGGAYLHRVGQDWALMTKDRPTLTGEEPAEAEVRGSALQPKLQSLVNGYQRIDGASLADYMTDAGFKTSTRYIDSYGWSVTCNGACYAYHVKAWSERGVIDADSYQRPRNYYIDTTSKNSRANLENQLKEITANNQANLQANPQFFVAPIETNSHGWAAFTDEESVRVNREGLEALVVERGDGQVVEASFANGGGYEEVRITDAESGETLERTEIPAGGVVIDESFDTDMVQVELGYAVEGGGFDSRGGSVLTSNPGEDGIRLTLRLS